MMTDREREYQREYIKRPHVIERMRAYQKEYTKRPEVKEKLKEYYRRPEVVARRKAYYSRPEVKERLRVWYQTYDGRCRKILREHHEALKDDPEHLTTEFLSKLIGCKCGRKK